MVSEWWLTVDGAPVEPMTVLKRRPYYAVFVGRARVASGQPHSTLLIERHRYIGGGMRENIVVRNLASEPVQVSLAVTVMADFADLFQVKAGRFARSGDPRLTAGMNYLLLEQPDRSHGVRVVVQADTDLRVGGNTMVFTPVIDANKMWAANLEIGAVVSGTASRPTFALDQPIDDAPTVRRTREWLETSPTVTSPDLILNTALRTTLRDLDALRIVTDDPNAPTLAAGTPWFLAMFGRDALLASLMALPLDPSLALGTLRRLARHQGIRTNPLTEEEPGRILHEIRSGTDAQSALGGTGVYYGAADTTPLFVVLLAEAARWGLDEHHIRELLPAADRALEWVRAVSDRNEDGFVTYQQSSERGLASQGWKDSPDAISFADGREAQPPIALCEVQAYVYAAYAGRADIARMLGDHDTEKHWRAQAGRLRVAFNRRFWLPSRGWYAVALDGDGAPVNSLTSNIGHCLWAGIADDDQAHAIAGHLMSPQMFTGWGVRTIASSMARYNPMSYHLGCVWPSDTAIAAAGLMRYGFVAEATRLAQGMLDAGKHFDGQLPELFCGFDREELEQPVPYPAACSPQSWSSTTPLYLLRTLLRLNPAVPDGVIELAPVLPARMLPLRVAGIPLGPARLDVEVDHDRVNVTGLPVGTRVVSQWPANHDRKL